ncbi:hypothetical protein AVEN_176494-1 [Araneus ventricosus]|uniref:Uncharacterized protein n=1 Tax=Araneus ventricosus TaxID=182803 RepID=A0A4Y2UW51_ARAVE|nr:hypothetical protein AVEN_176494-1 [Araneus ventricosus]
MPSIMADLMSHLIPYSMASGSLQDSHSNLEKSGEYCGSQLFPGMKQLDIFWVMRMYVDGAFTAAQILRFCETQEGKTFMTCVKVIKAYAAKTVFGKPGTSKQYLAMAHGVQEKEWSKEWVP